MSHNRKGVRCRPLPASLALLEGRLLRSLGVTKASFRTLGVTIVAALSVSACAFDQETIAYSTPQVVVHAVLDPSATMQIVLVEKTLTGTVFINDNQRFDVLDPVNTAGGLPIANAQVTITGPDGVLIGKERTFTGKAAGYGTGRYEVLAGLPEPNVFKAPIRPGATYTLTVKTPDGVIVTGKTVVPSAPPMITTPTVLFDRSKDTLKINWAPVTGARSFGVRVESPFGALLLFSDSTKLSIAGSFRNFFADDFQRLFIPGFQQVSTIFAADTNYFDYYRSRNDPFTGSGIINNLSGGIGLFGSIVVIDSRLLDVTQPIKEPKFEGEYEIVQSPVTTGGRPYVDVLKLFVETPGTSASLSGWYQKDRKVATRDGLAGARDGDRIELQFTNNSDVHSTFVRFVGTQVGDSLKGNYNGIAGLVVFKKRP
ncbi:MAG: DUF4249 family protein [Gemmatimonadota bacterium]